MDLIIPARSPLRLTAIGDGGDAVFDGCFLLSGSYRYGHINERASGIESPPEFRFMPEPDIGSRLPRWEVHRRVFEVQFDNVDAFLRAVVLESALGSLRDGRISAITERTTVWVDRYRVAKGQAKPVYSIRFIAPGAMSRKDLRREPVESPTAYA